MFFSNIKIAEKYNYLDEKFVKAYHWLAETDILSLEVGKYPIDGDNVYALVQEYTTKTADEGYFEAHDDYFDIQYVAAGREMFGVCNREGLVEREHPEGKDLIFYEEPEYCGYVFLGEGDAIVVAPEDAHKPRVNAGEPCNVKKVVVKVAV